MDLVLDVYAVTKRFPSEERFGLAAQMRRAAVSIPANIAEGNARDSTAEYRHFLSIARGSVAELDTEFAIAERLGYVDGELTAQPREYIDRISRLLTNLRRSLRR